MELVNQQERPVNVDFVAGLVCGEGWFGISAQKTAKGGITYRPAFGIQMNDNATMQLVIDFFKENRLPIYVPYFVKTSAKTKGLRICIMGCKRTKRLCEFFIPYLRGTKKKAAEKVLEFINSRFSKKRQSPYSEDELQMIRDLRWKINSGRRHPSLESSETTRCAPSPVMAGEDIVRTQVESLG